MADVYHALGLHMHQPLGNLVSLHNSGESWEARQILWCYDRPTRMLEGYEDVARLHLSAVVAKLHALIVPRYAAFAPVVFCANTCCFCALKSITFSPSREADCVLFSQIVLSGFESALLFCTTQHIYLCGARHRIMVADTTPLLPSDHEDSVSPSGNNLTPSAST